MIYHELNTFHFNKYRQSILAVNAISYGAWKFYYKIQD